MCGSIVVVKKGEVSDKVCEELTGLHMKLSIEQLNYMGDTFKKKVSNLITPVSEEYFKETDVETFCKVVEGKIVSFLSIQHTVGMIGVQYLYTLPEYRRKGHMVELFDALFKQYNKEDHYFYLISYVKNTASVKLYEKIGFISNYVTMEL